MLTILLLIGLNSNLFLSGDNSNVSCKPNFLRTSNATYFSDSTSEQALQSYQSGKTRHDQITLGNVAFELGMKYYDQEKYDQAIVCFEEVIAIADKTQDAVLVAKTLDKMAAIYRKKDLPAQALPLAKEALQYAYSAQHPEVLISLIRNLGKTYWLLQNYDSALHFYKQRILLCTEQGNTQKLIEAYTDVAAILYSIRKFEDCIFYYEQALKLSIQTDNTDHLANINTYLASAYSRIGAHQEAYFALLTSLPLLQQKKNQKYLSAAYFLLGSVSLQLMNIEDAIDFFTQSLKISEIIKDEKAVANSLINLGMAYYHSKSYDEARKYFVTANGLTKKNSLIEKQAYAQENLGRTYLALQQQDSALFYYRAALQIRQQIAQPPHPNLADIHTELGRAYLAAKENDRVEYHIQESLQALGIVEVDQSWPILALPAEHAPVSKEEYLDLMRLKGDYLGSAFDDTTAWEAGLQHYEKGIQFLLESYVFAQDLEQSKLAWLTLYRPMFESGIALAQRLYIATGKAGYLERAFALVEQNKALLLRQSLLESQATASANLPDSLRDTERTYKQSISQKETALLKAEQAKDSTKAWEIRREVTELRQQYFDWKEDVAVDFDTLANEVNSVSIREIQQQLAPRTGLINYFLGEKHLFSFSITKDTVLSYQYELPEDWNTRLQTFYHALTNHKDLISNKDEAVRKIMNDIGEQGHYFYQTLAAPFLENTHENLEKLIVVPDGMLNLIPFSVLLTESTQASEYSAFPYLLKKLSIQHAYSASLYFQPSSSHSPEKQYTFGSFTADYSIKDPSDTMTYSLVPNAQKLAKDAASLMRGEVWEQATKEAFLTHASQCKVIHFSGHAVADNTDLSDNRLVFHADPPQDRYLYLPEIYNLNLEGTDLAVLSGCNTGSGAIKGGEGIISTARAFQYAGAKNVLLALSVIPDASTEELLQIFYKNLRMGFIIDKALQQAKLQYLNKYKDDPLLSHPLFWANIITFGRGEDIIIDVPQHPFNLLPIIAMVLLLLVGGWLFWNFNRKHKTISTTQKALRLFLGYLR